MGITVFRFGSDIGDAVSGGKKMEWKK